MEIKCIISEKKKFPLPQRVCDGEKGKIKCRLPQPQFPRPSSEMQPSVASLAPSLGTMIIPSTKTHYDALASSIPAPRVTAPSFSQLIIALLKLSFPPAASHLGVSGSGTSAEYNESLSFHSLVPSFAEQGNEHLCLTCSGGVLHKPDGETQPSSELLTKDDFIAEG